MSTFPEREAEFRAWIENFVTGCNANATALKLSTGELSDIGAKADEFISDYNTLITKKADLKSFIQTKNVSLDAIQDLVRTLNKRFRTTVGVTPTILSSLGLPVYQPPTAQTPKQPLDLQADAKSNGNVLFTFKRNGNKPGAVFIFESSEDGASDWTSIATTTKTRVTIYGFTPGVRAFVRVYALVNDEKGTPSEPVVLYTQAGNQFLSVAA